MPKSPLKLLATYAHALPDGFVSPLGAGTCFTRIQVKSFNLFAEFQVIDCEPREIRPAIEHDEVIAVSAVF